MMSHLDVVVGLITFLHFVMFIKYKNEPRLIAKYY
jgi:hypothetical protein